MKKRNNNLNINSKKKYLLKLNKKNKKKKKKNKKNKF